MKTKIVIGCIIAVCVLLMVPTIPAIKSNIATEKIFNNTSLNLKNFLTRGHLDIRDLITLLGLLWIFFIYNILGIPTPKI